MTALWFKISSILPAALALASCAAPPSAGSMSDASPDDVHPALISVGGELQEIALRRGPEPSWEQFRNDAAEADPNAPLHAPRIFLEVRHHEHLSTINGRPREFTSTRTRSIRREFRREHR